MWTVDFEAMGCHARAALDRHSARAEAILAHFPRWVARRERVLSRFEPQSALARLNAQGSATRVGDILWTAIDVSLRTAEATGGLVTPTVLSALEAAGYDRSFDRVASVQDAVTAPRSTVGDWREVRRDTATRTIRLPRGLRLDLAGTAKAWCVDTAAAYLGGFGPALVEIGGDIAVSGGRREPWPVAVQDPRTAGEHLELVLLERGGIATSGRDFRRWQRRGVAQHHIIDPRTGEPARTDVLTATVVADGALEADIAAKRILLDGSAAGLEWVEARADLAAIVVRDDGRVLRSTRMARHVWRGAA